MNEYKNTAERTAAGLNSEGAVASVPGNGSCGEAIQAYPKRRSEKRDLILAAVLLGFCFLLWDAFCWAAGLGLGEALGLAGLLPAALIYLRKREGRLTPYGKVCTGLYLLGALSLILSGDRSLQFLTLCAMVPLFLIAVLAEALVFLSFRLPARHHLRGVLLNCLLHVVALAAVVHDVGGG